MLLWIAFEQGVALQMQPFLAPIICTPSLTKHRHNGQALDG